MRERVGVGVVGTSWWADLMHLPSLASHPQARLVAICGRNQTRAAKLAAKYGIPHVFADYRAMFEQVGLDAVVIATPDYTHYAMTMAALDAGLHVLCEKPLALNAKEARAMQSMAESKGVKHMVAFTWRWIPHYRHLYELVRGDYTGKHFHAYFSYLSGGGRKAEYNWRYDSRYGTGALGNLGAHMIDLARWWLGDVTQVNAHLDAFVERPGVQGEPLEAACDAFFLSLIFGNGVHAVVQAGEVFQTGERYHEQQVRLYGESGTLEATLALTGTDLARQLVTMESKICGAHRDSPRFTCLPLPEQLLEPGVDPGNFLDPFLCQSAGARHFIDAIVADRMPSPNFCDGVAVQEVIDAALQSQLNGGWVPLRSPLV
jgi:predicted dehydrogenase